MITDYQHWPEASTIVMKDDPTIDERLKPTKDNIVRLSSLTPDEIKVADRKKKCGHS